MRPVRFAIAAVGVIASTAVFVLARPVPPLAAGDVAPAWEGRTLDGSTVRLNDLRGQVVLLNVWATWCHPCRREMPALQRLQDTFGARGLHVVAVSVDGPNGGADIRRFLDEHGLSLTVLHDAAGGVERTFSTHGVPETFLIGADGVVRRRWTGRIDPGSPGVVNAVLDALAERG